MNPRHLANEAFDHFLDFIAHFCTELAAGASPEHALGRAVHYYGERSPAPFSAAFEAIVRGTDSFVSAWRKTVESYHHSDQYRLLLLLSQFLDRGARVAGVRMLRVIQQVRKNTTLAKNRENLVDAQRSKALALVIVSSAVLGTIAAIAPFVAATFTPVGLVHQQGSLSVVLHISSALYLTTIVAAYRLGQAARSSTRTLLLCSLSFLVAFALTTNLLAAIP